MDISVLYEDNHVIVCVKPAGVLSQGGELDKPDMLSILKDYLKRKYDKPGNVYLGLVHRLDLNVGGVMVFAKTSKAAARLSAQIRDNLFSKRYLAVAKGEFLLAKGRYEDLLEKDESLKMARSAESGQGKLATLEYKVIDLKMFGRDQYSLVDIALETGRFHQIRYQFALHGHPLMGDTKYGDRTNNPDFFLGLFAYRIEFDHPISKEKMVFQTLPGDDRFKEFSGLHI